MSADLTVEEECQKKLFFGQQGEGIMEQKASGAESIAVVAGFLLAFGIDIGRLFGLKSKLLFAGLLRRHNVQLGIFLWRDEALCLLTCTSVSLEYTSSVIFSMLRAKVNTSNLTDAHR